VIRVDGMHLSEINIYPVKSLRGIWLSESTVEPRGLTFDRRWMLVDSDGRFMTQREFPRMALISVEVNSSGLTVGAPETEPLWISSGAKKDTVRSHPVTIWNSVCEAAFYPAEVNAWFSGVLGTECRLVAMPETTKRPVDPEYALRPADDHVSFADGYPFLLIGEGALADLNSRLEEKVPMNRFRPNFVVAGSEAFAEDGWKKIRIGETIFHVVKPSARCVLTTVDQATGIKDGKEPLRTLASFRTVGQKVLFGQNLIAEDTGRVIRVGDKVEVLETTVL